MDDTHIFRQRRVATSKHQDLSRLARYKIAKQWRYIAVFFEPIKGRPVRLAVQYLSDEFTREKGVNYASYR